MPKYQVNISEKCYGFVEVEANNESEACEKAEDAISCGLANFVGKVEYETYEVAKLD